MWLTIWLYGVILLWHHNKKNCPTIWWAIWLWHRNEKVCKQVRCRAFGDQAIGMFTMTSRLGLVGRDATTPRPVKSIVFTRVRYLPELIISLLFKIQEIYSYIIKGHISLPDHITSPIIHDLNENIFKNLNVNFGPVMWKWTSEMRRVTMHKSA